MTREVGFQSAYAGGAVGQPRKRQAINRRLILSSLRNSTRVLGMREKSRAAAGVSVFGGSKASGISLGTLCAVGAGAFVLSQFAFATSAEAQVFINDGVDNNCTRVRDMGLNSVLVDVATNNTKCGTNPGNQQTHSMFYGPVGASGTDPTTPVQSNNLSLGGELYVNAGRLGLSDKSGMYSMKIGSSATLSNASHGLNSIAIGSDQTAANTLGAATVANGVSSIAIGSRAVSNLDYGLALGFNATNYATNSIAMGSNASVIAGANDGVAIGPNSAANYVGAVAIGSGSQTGAVAPTGLGYAAPLGAVVPTSELSIGSATSRRRLTNLAAGSAPTDAVNVSQLNTVGQNLAAALGGGTAFDSTTGAFTPPSYSVNGATVNNVGAALTNLDGRTGTNEDDIEDLQNGVTGLVRQANSTAPVTVAAGSGGNEVSLAGTDGNRRLTGVAAGSLAAGSTEAVNGGQLNTTNQGLVSSVAALGGGAVYDPATGTFTAPTFTLSNGAGGTTNYNNVGAALGNLDGRVSSNALSIAGLENGTLGLVRQATNTAEVTVAAQSLGSIVNFRNSGGDTRTLTGVTAATLTATSTEAVNGSQLYGTDQRVAGTVGALGGGAAIDAAGNFVAPTYAIQGNNYNNVGSALNAVDTNLTSLTNAINGGTAGLVQQANGTAPITVAATSGGDELNIAGTAGERRLTGLAEGELSATSDEAVTGSQLHTTNAGLVSSVGALGAGADYDPATGLFTAPTYTLQNAAGGTSNYDNVGDALSNLDGRTASNTTNIAGVLNGTLGLVRQASNTDEVTVAAQSAGSVVNFQNVDGDDRTLSGVADGTLSDTSNEAVNGSQLYATNERLAGSIAALGGGAGIDGNGVFVAPSYAIQGNNYNNVGSALNAVDTNLTSLTNGINNGSIGLVRQQSASAPVTIAASTGGNEVNMAGTDGDRRISGVAAGTISATSNDAVAGSQLHATNQGVAGAMAGLGGGASYDPVTGAVTAPTFVLQDGNGGTASYNNAGDAFANLDGRVAQNANDLAALQGDINSGQVGLVRQAAPGADLTVGAHVDGAAVDFAGTSGERKLTSVAAGTISDTSTDAINGSQLYAANRSIASALGGGTGVAPDGTLTQPSFMVAGNSYDSVGGAFGAIDNRVNALETTVNNGMAVGPVTQGSAPVATHANAMALGAGAVTTRPNQIAMGGANSTYTMAGIASDDSRAAQSGPLQVVTSDANGNLATADLTSFYPELVGLGQRLGDMDKRFDRHADGIAIAVAMGGAHLPIDSRYAISGNVGVFDGTGALGFAGAARLNRNWWVHAAGGLGFQRNTVAGRVGVTFAW